MNTPVCPTCKSPLPENAPQGLCPRCLIDAMAAPATMPVQGEEENIPLLGPHFPQLVIEELIGTGGMGRVYRARQPHLNRTVALKLLTPERADDEEWLERFGREARALARLSHPHIVQVYDFGEAPMPYLIMEYVEGVNLRQAMDGGGLSAREALAIVPKLCDALHYAHEQGVLHRDIKPENILIDTEGRVKIVDFGLAKLREEHGLPFTVTRTGAKLGTLAYMAPEQIEKPSDVDHRADLYSLGVVLYEMLTGELPLGRFPTPSEASGVDPRLDRVVLRTLEKRREKRFSDAAEMKSGIEQASTGPVPPVRSPRWDDLNYEFRSRAHIASWPLLHICFGKDEFTGKMKRARGVIAIGGHAQGVVALGLFAVGLFSWGVFSVGLLASGVMCSGFLSQGLISTALLAAFGVFAIAPVAIGVTPLGYIAAGVTALGAHTASTSGTVDPLAARIGDAWSLPVYQWGHLVNSVCLTTLMLAGAFAAWKTAKPWRHKAMYLALALIGPFNYFGVPGAWRIAPSFSERLENEHRWAKARQESSIKQARSAREERVRKAQYALTTEASRTDSLQARDKAFDEMQEAVESSDPERIETGLMAITWSPKVPVDFTRFRDAIRRHLDHEEPQIRKWAILALFRPGYEPADEEHLLKMIPGADREILDSLARVLSTLSNGDFTGKFSAPMLSILRQAFEIKKKENRSKGGYFDERQILGALWGAKWSPEIETLILEWSRLVPGADGKLAPTHEPIECNYEVMYHALSVQANKSRASLQRVLELARSADVTNVSGRILWGLPGSVANKADYPFVAASVIELLGQRNDDSLWLKGLRSVELYASTEHLPALAALATREALPPERKEALNKIIARLKQPQP